jgi:hypothetical protein
MNFGAISGTKSQRKTDVKTGEKSQKDCLTVELETDVGFPQKKSPRDFRSLLNRIFSHFAHA